MRVHLRLSRPPSARHLASSEIQWAARCRHQQPHLAELLVLRRRSAKTATGMTERRRLRSATAAREIQVSTPLAVALSGNRRLPLEAAVALLPLVDSTEFLHNHHCHLQMRVAMGSPLVELLDPRLLGPPQRSVSQQFARRRDCHREIQWLRQHQSPRLSAKRLGLERQRHRLVRRHRLHSEIQRRRWMCGEKPPCRCRLGTIRSARAGLAPMVLVLLQLVGRLSEVTPIKRHSDNQQLAFL